MKNYPHLYSNILSKKAQINSNKTPKKPSALTGTTLTSKASAKTLGIYKSTLNRQKATNRILTRSIEEQYRSENESSQFNGLTITNGSQDEELFSQSYSKIGKIKQQYPYKNIDIQLNEVLNLIKQQKTKINDKLKNLKKSNEYYKKICEDYRSKCNDYGMNTEQIITSTSQKRLKDQAVGSQLNQEIKIEEQPQQILQDNLMVNKQVYIKLSSMLQEMNINPRDILPSQHKINDQILISDYKNLTEKETIRIQKFFIKKLIAKITK